MGNDEQHLRDLADELSRLNRSMQDQQRKRRELVTKLDDIKRVLEDIRRQMSTQGSD